MTINKKGGKHKHRKRQRDFGDRKNPKHIKFADYKNGEFYAIVQRCLGCKRFEVKIIDTKWGEGSNLVFNAPLRGSKKLRRFSKVQIEDMVKVEYDASIKSMRIVLPYQEWEKNYIENDYDDEGNCRIIKSTVGGFDFSEDAISTATTSGNSKSSDNSISIAQLTGIASSDEEEEEETPSQKSVDDRKKQRQKDLDEFIDAI